MKPNSRGARGRSVFIVLVTVQLSFASIIGWAQSDESAPPSKLRYFRDANPPPDHPTNPQNEGGQSVIAEVPYSQVFKGTDQVDLFRETHIDKHTLEPRVGSGGATMDVGVISGRIAAPFTTRPAFKPEDAEIKISNFYIDIRSLSASVLHSDNVNQTENNPQSGTLMALRLDFAAMAQVTETFKISAAGAVLYLPFENRFGFAVYDPYRQFEYFPLFRVQLAYDLNLSNWEIEAINDFTIKQIPYGIQLSYSYFDGAFENPQREGRYVYGGGASGTRVFEDRSPYRDFDAGLVQAENTVGGRVSRLLPTETRASFGGFHSDYWFLSGEDDIIVLPHTLDWAYASLRSERENLRFKPFVGFRAIKYDYYTSWEYEVRGGIEGPITPNIDFYGAVGQRWLYLGGSETIWDIRLRHQIGPYTYHSFEYNQDVTDPERDLRQRWIYRITQILGDGLVGEVFGTWANFDDLDKTDTSGDQWVAGVRLTYTPSIKTTMQLGGTFNQYLYDRAGAPDSDTWRLFFIARHKFTPTFEGTVQYNYTDRDSTRPGDSYKENMGTVSVIKYF